MNSPASRTLSTPALAATAPPTHAALPAPAATALALLQGMTGGSLGLRLPDGRSYVVGDGPLQARLEVHAWGLFERVLGEGDIGFAESYLDGHWETDDLTALLTLLANNRHTLARAVHGRWWAVLGHRIRHLLRANTRAGSRRNILAHYDLGNDFYATWLDRSMTYSAALFAHADMPLELAQQAKYQRILDQLDPRPGDTILEIGCGWGGFAEMAVTRYGCKLHGVTLSPAQLAYARERAERGGWADRAHFELRDYRDLQGQYDHVVSIEMLEAVGERFWDVYFRQVRDCLRPGGRAMIQVITIDDARFAAYRRGTDFIQRHIFPGGMLISPREFDRHSARADFHIVDRHAFGLDYARTLQHWHRGFSAAWSGIAGRNGFDERFNRLWRFYLAYCEAGFRAGATDVYQFLIERRACP